MAALQSDSQLLRVAIVRSFFICYNEVTKTINAFCIKCFFVRRKRMIELREKPNRGKSHLFLGNPMSNGLDKTVVEPGNAFSPGLWTLGVSVAVRNGELVAPQNTDLPLAFDSQPPVTVSEYDVGGAKVRSELCHLGGTGWQGVDFFRVTIDRDVEEAALVITDIGPAGGKIRGISWNGDVLEVVGGPKFEFETPVDVTVLPADDDHDSPCAFVHFQRELAVRVSHGYEGRAYQPFALKARPRHAMTVAEGFAEARRQWREALPSRVYAPDPRIEKVWEETAFHMLSAMECGLPRISVNNYPIFWIRDCVIVLRALDMMGRSDLARIGCDYLLPTVFSGGFGAEADNPGEGLWALGEHALFTGDAEWAKKTLPHLEERVAWIEKMLAADEIIYRPADMRTIWAHYYPGSDVVCLPHEGNHIHGRMDGHCPDYYINCWALAGLSIASETAALAGADDLSKKWAEMAAKLGKAINEELLPKFGNERDTCVAPWPCGVPEGDVEALRGPFNKWYDENRLNPDGTRKREPLWTYFEAAQIHNAFLLGERERAWACLDGFLSDEAWRGMSIFTEGRWGANEMLPFGTGKYGRGWLQEGATGANMPHNWTTSEALALLRDLFVTEEVDGLRLLCGVPKAWLVPGAKFGVEKLPTRFGIVSFEATVDANGSVELHFAEGGNIPYRLDLPQRKRNE